MLGTTFHLFFLSLQTPMYESEEIINSLNPPLQEATGNEFSVARMYKKCPPFVPSCSFCENSNAEYFKQILIERKLS